jgi:hypothetical protein
VKIAVIGDSHTGLVTAGARRIGAPIVGGPLVSAIEMHRRFFAAHGTDLVPISERVREAYEKWKTTTQSAGIFDWPNGLVVSMGLAAAPFYGNKTWLRFRKRPISKNLMQTIIDDMQAPAIEFYEVCISRGLLLAAIDAPPPQRNHRAVEALGAERVFELAEIFTKPVRDLLNKHQVPILSVQAADEEGFLIDAFIGDNESHGNAEWGASVARLIMQCAATSDRSSGLERTAIARQA